VLPAAAGVTTSGNRWIWVDGGKGIHMNTNQRFVVTFFLGFLGVHRFIDRKYGTGLVWLVTGGLLWFGWVWDLCLAGKEVLDERRLGGLAGPEHRRE
jgi:hypothetical protein